MIRAATLVLCAALVASAVLPTPAAAAAVESSVMTPAEVVALGGDRDGMTVTVRGEALGETLDDGLGGSWVNVLGDGVALGLFGEPDLFEPIDGYGDYHTRGSIVEATGTYNAACDRHGGDRDVHIDVLRVVEAARPLDRPVHPWKAIAGLAMGGAAAALWLRYRRRLQRAF